MSKNPHAGRLFSNLPPGRRCTFGHSAKRAASNSFRFHALFLFGFAQAYPNKKRESQRDQTRGDKYFKETQQG